MWHRAIHILLALSSELRRVPLTDEPKLTGAACRSGEPVYRREIGSITGVWWQQAKDRRRLLEDQDVAQAELLKLSLRMI